MHLRGKAKGLVGGVLFLKDVHPQNGRDLSVISRDNFPRGSQLIQSTDVQEIKKVNHRLLGRGTPRLLRPRLAGQEKPS